MDRAQHLARGDIEQERSYGYQWYNMAITVEKPTVPIPANGYEMRRVMAASG